MLNLSYRPFLTTYGWIDSQINDRPGLQNNYFPTSDSENIEIIMGERGPFITNQVPDLELDHHGQCFPLYWYEKVDTLSDEKQDNQNGRVQKRQEQFIFEYGEETASSSNGYIKHFALTDTALHMFQATYPNTRISRHSTSKKTTYSYDDKSQIRK